MRSHYRVSTLILKSSLTFTPACPRYCSSNFSLVLSWQVPDHLEPGLDDKQLTRLLGLELQNSSSNSEPEPQKPSPEPINPPVVPEPQRKISRERKISVTPRRRHISILELSPEEIAQRLEKQIRENQWHQFTENNLIIKQGLVDKRKVSIIYDCHCCAYISHKSLFFFTNIFLL